MKRSKETKIDRVKAINTVLRKRIASWEYAPGTRLTEEELSNEFNVSRVPLREALGQLEVQGFVSKIRNKGYTVRLPDLREILDLYDMRLALELHAVEGLTRKPATPEMIAELLEIWERPVDHTNDIPAVYSLKDQKFHETVAEYYGNNPLLELLRNINEKINVFRRMDFTREEEVNKVKKNHEVIIRAIEQQNVENARETMKNNIEHAKDQVEFCLKEMLWQIHTGKR